MTDFEIVRFGSIRVAAVEAEGGVRGRNIALSRVLKVFPKPFEGVKYGLYGADSSYLAGIVLDWRNRDRADEGVVVKEIKLGDYAFSIVKGARRRNSAIQKRYELMEEFAAQQPEPRHRHPDRYLVEKYRTAGAVALLLPLLDREKE